MKEDAEAVLPQPDMQKSDKNSTGEWRVSGGPGEHPKNRGCAGRSCKFPAHWLSLIHI